jgi:transcription elongation GreA/GreB family factor
MRTQTTTSDLAASGRWIPMTPEAFRRLETEADRLVATVGDSQSTAWADGISGEPDAPTFVANGELHLLTQRLAKLRAAIANSHVVQPDGRVVVGTRITVSDAHGLEAYELVAPGQADARAGRISSDSPLGAALLGRRADDAVDVATLAGTHRVTIVRVE